ncbi:hypothetical protein FIBSPDRAFT_1043137 [Athelia psychrophila]|uniref:ATP-dependent RNA helicase n=1 Tax=Athelia psychrophila TaxID=1759441 RepID=A0A166LHM0_9AGAM|nr:hypothetical protein FIBSPDRAFT_1043137 [Fibularhizoctonia sp. CBS 109695]
MVPYSRLPPALASIRPEQPHLLRSIHANQFLFPTPIHCKPAPSQPCYQAATGSATLAYDLPIMHHNIVQPSLIAIVGGMSAQRQQRVLDRGVEVFVVTPRRLWDILEDDDELAKQIRGLMFLAADKPGRMVEAGHFQELAYLPGSVLRIQFETKFENLAKRNENNEARRRHANLRLLRDAQKKPTVQRQEVLQSMDRGQKDKCPTAFDDLLFRLDFRDPEPEVVDISPEGGVVSSQKEADRSSSVLHRRDTATDALAELLGLKVYPLHSQLEQPQHFKNLDRFKSTPNIFLLAPNIAAHRLDIPAVDHVTTRFRARPMHTSTEMGGQRARCARASACLCASPTSDELQGRAGGSGSTRDRNTGNVHRAGHAGQAQSAQVRLGAPQGEEGEPRQELEKEAVEAMELQLGLSDDEDGEDLPTKFKVKSRNVRMAATDAELKRMLAELIAKGVSTWYITSVTRPIMDDVISVHANHEAMLGLKWDEPGSDMMPRKKVKAPIAEDEELKEEEWQEWQN